MLLFVYHFYKETEIQSKNWVFLQVDRSKIKVPCVRNFQGKFEHLFHINWTHIVKIIVIWIVLEISK